MLTVTPLVTLAAMVPAVVAGSGGAGGFTLALSAAQDHGIIVNLIVKGSAKRGVDYVPIRTFRKIKAGKTSVKLKVEPLGEVARAGDKRIVALRLAPGGGYTVGIPSKVKVKILGQ